ncbi:hypothetical protein [Spiroplasma phoeniceum]|uniref:Lipoprotein n=1 Tax=Spiroplasma phoeniceum P40 TaxID=1276259 RepID=A0A345DLQ7_9MOLU|nr:hypothetical protein [Spiroplasma phoeniceum]AXF95145.1 hypothetical protein SDAV_00141 [Spiroplasma phoeniceum P40]
MKKLFILLTSFSISTLSTISMIACGCTYPKNNQLEEETKLEDTTDDKPAEPNKNKKIDISKIEIINSPERILAKNPTCVSKDEWWEQTKIKVYEALHNIDQSLTKDDIKIQNAGYIKNFEKDFQPCYLNKNVSEKNTILI